MSLTGNLRTMALPEILQWISSGRKTGTLYVERLSIEKRIVFQDGYITTSWSNDPRESLGQFLIRDHRITEEQLFKALLRQESHGQLIGAFFVGEGVLSEEGLRRSLEAKVVETIQDLFLWTDGKFEFREGELPGNVHIQIQASVTAVVLEGARRVDEWMRIRQVFPSSRTTFRLKGAPVDLKDLTERQILGLCAMSKSLAEISLELRRSEFEAASLLFDLYNRGLIEVDQSEPDLLRDPVRAIRELLDQAGQKLEAVQLDAAMRLYEDVLALDRINQDAKKGLLAVVEARNRQRILASVPLAKVPVLCVDYATLTRETVRPPRRLRAVSRQRSVGRAVDPEAVPDGRAGRAADLRPPARAQGHRADRPRLTRVKPAQSRRPRTGAIWRSSPIIASNACGVIDCGPSESARSGIVVDLHHQPVGPHRGRRPRQRHDLLAASRPVRGVHQDRQVAHSLDRRHHRQVQRVAREVRERAHPTLAQDHLVVALGEDVLGRHQELLERRRHAPLQHHRLARLAHPLEQRVVLHVAGADLDGVGVALDQLHALHVHRLGHDRQARRLAGLGQDLQALLAEPLKGSRDWCAA